MCIRSEAPARILNLALGVQSYQHVYLALLYGLLAIKSVLVDDFTALAEGVIGSVRVKPLTRGEAAVLWGGKALYAAWFLALPALYSGHSWGALAVLWLTAEAVAGWTLAFMFQVLHAYRSLATPVVLVNQTCLPSYLCTLWQPDVQLVDALPYWLALPFLTSVKTAVLGPEPDMCAGHRLRMWSAMWSFFRQTRRPARCRADGPRRRSPRRRTSRTVHGSGPTSAADSTTRCAA